ncbi:hypothetical protein RU07_03035 [Agrobacterium tumefaciens]|uniref:Uncharacterized protein n=1 Tax=Agrobacterium tumefaciens TaxID=358 RepID=A0A0D0KYT1_AGRTU|nr:hypothetical protein RU07_03035 [Agrobacterium tumefaciens]
MAFCCFDITFGSETFAWKAAAMNSATFFFLYILPLLISAGVWSAIWVSDANRARRQKIHPGE